MFRTHRAIVHRDRTFSEPLTGVVYNGDMVRVCIGGFVSRRVFSHNFSAEIFRYLRPCACSARFGCYSHTDLYVRIKSTALLVQFGIYRVVLHCDKAAILDMLESIESIKYTVLEKS